MAVGLPNAEWTTGSGNSHFGLWDIDTNDWRLSLSSSGWSESAMMRELNKASDGDVILMHDGFSGRSRGLAVLQSWLAVNADLFDFRVLPGCHEEPTEPSIDPANPAGWHRFQIARLYRAYFDRQPDAEGWEYWSEQFISGATLAEISFWFAQSSEFNRSTELDDQGFVQFVYANVLDREPDAEGFGYWLGQLGVNVDRGELVLYFSESAEFTDRTAPVITGDCYQGDTAGAYRCYSETLDPLPGFKE